MNKSITAISMTLFLVACGGSGSTNESPAAAASPELGAALPDATSTSTLEIDRDFAFETARTVDVAFDIEAARNADATVTICTDFIALGAEYDVDFNSCTASGPLDNGTFNHSMKVTNDKESVVGVVLFQDVELPPLYKEFAVDSNQRSKGDGTFQRVIVWN